MEQLLTVTDVYLDQDLKTKAEVFAKVQEILTAAGAVKPCFLEAMKQRNQEASVALGNYLILPHATQTMSDCIINNKVIILHLKNPIDWDGEQGQIVMALALHGDKQMDLIQAAGIAFSDIEAVESLLNKNDLAPHDFLDFINQAL
ncbi:PTS sugar transporter subunit IIA [Candidatus Mycoplasma pogonae]